MQSKTSVISPTERAWKSVRAFSRMTSTLTGFARAITGNQKVRVQAGKVTSTDGKTIFIVPPLALGDDLVHERDLCETREYDGQQACIACRRNETVMRRIYHEIAHILGNTMVAPDREHVMQAMNELIDEWHPADACKHGEVMKRKMSISKNYISVFREFHGYTELIVQALEDSRIDGQMLAARPGLRKQFYATTYATFTEGVEKTDGTMVMWRDAPINPQVIIGLMLTGAGYSIDEAWLSEPVLEILQRQQIADICTAATHGESMHRTALHTIEMFRVLNDMGLCVVEKCEVPPPSLNKPGDKGDESDEQKDSESASDGEAGKDSSDPGSDDADSSADGSAGSGDSDDVSSGDGTAGDSAKDGGFGKDFENPDARSDGSDKEGGDSGAEPEGKSVPDVEGDDKPEGSDADSDDTDGDDGSSAGSDGRDTEAGGENKPGSTTEDPDADDLEIGADGSESSESSEESHAGGDEDASDSDGDSDGESESSGDSTSQEAGDTGEADSSDADGSEHPESEDGASTVDDGADASRADGGRDGGDPEGRSQPVPDGDEEEDLQVDEPIGADVWSQEELGTFEEVEAMLKQFGGHEQHEGGDDELGIQSAEDAAYDDEYSPMRVAISQSQHFDRSSEYVVGVSHLTFPNQQSRWPDSSHTHAKQFMPEEKIIGKSLMQARIVFAANKIAKKQGNLTSGKVNTRVLGRRAALDDERLFRNKVLPGKRDYVVGITVDCSGSTDVGTRMERIKRAVFAQAELLARLGVKFYITGHSGGPDYYINNYKGSPDDPRKLWILDIKGIDEPWNDATRKRLANLRPQAENYDGHTLEYHRKQLEFRPETDKILLYFTDGAMPAANYDEELEILQTEIKACAQKKITLMAVGINTNSPERYGFDTVQVDSDEDLQKVIAQLKRRLLG